MLVEIESFGIFNVSTIKNPISDFIFKSTCIFLSFFADPRKLPQVCPGHLQGVDEGDGHEGRVHHNKVP
jgi:hypothetical protein